MELPPKTVAEVDLPAPRLKLDGLPAQLQEYTTDAKFERLLHSGGRDFFDLLRNTSGGFVEANSGASNSNSTAAAGVVDLVAFPRTEQEVLAVLQFCTKRKVACIPFGGGSSVCSGVEPPSAASLAAGGLVGVIALDTRRLNQIYEVDEESMAIRVGGGMYVALPP
jgi:alkyldihydroxyacetonephosphate synthase